MVLFKTVAGETRCKRGANTGPIWGLGSFLSQFASGPGVNVHPLLSSGVRTPQYWRNKRVYGPVSVSSRDVAAVTAIGVVSAPCQRFSEKFSALARNPLLE